MPKLKVRGLFYHAAAESANYPLRSPCPPGVKNGHGGRSKCPNESYAESHMRLLSKQPSGENVAHSSGEEPNRLATSLSGCAFLLFVLLITTGMLIVNAVVCLSVHTAFMTFGPAAIVNNPSLAPYIGQLFYFLVPVLLTIIQWNLLDRLNRLFRRP